MFGQAPDVSTGLTVCVCARARHTTAANQARPVDFEPVRLIDDRLPAMATTTDDPLTSTDDDGAQYLCECSTLLISCYDRARPCGQLAVVEKSIWTSAELWHNVQRAYARHSPDAGHACVAEGLPQHPELDAR